MKVKINNNTIYIDSDGAVEIYGDEGDTPFFNKEDLPELIELLLNTLEK